MASGVQYVDGERGLNLEDETKPLCDSSPAFGFSADYLFERFVLSFICITGLH